VTAQSVVGVVVPYYQREAGILGRALRSIALQEGVEGIAILVVVVDDASPAPADAEIEGLDGQLPFRIQTIVQSNAGPAAARNRGIEALPVARYIAFLDSDDEWRKDHLRRAVRALSTGFDVYFSDFLQPGVDVTAFKRAGRIEPSAHPRIGGLEDLHAYAGDMFDQVLTGNVIGTPTVVYDRQRFPTVLFRPEYTNAGEDYLFWIDLARGGARFAFSSRVEVDCGFGVNVYAGAGWGTETHFLRLHNEMKYRKAVLREFALTAIQRAKIHSDVARLRRAMSRDMLHRITHRRAMPITWLRAHARLDPLTFAALPYHSFGLVLEAVGKDRNRTIDGD